MHHRLRGASVLNVAGLPGPAAGGARAASARVPRRGAGARRNRGRLSRGLQCRAGDDDDGSRPVDDGSYDKPPLDKRAAVMALESLFASSVEIDDDGQPVDAGPPEGLPVWCHGNAMLPGFREVLGVHQPAMIAMFSKLLSKPRPWRYVHFSRSSSFAEAAGHPSRGPQEPAQDSALHPPAEPGRPAVGTLMEVVVADRADDGRLFLAVRALGAVQLLRVTQTSPHFRAVVEWRPDEEETAAAGAEAPAVCAAEAWAALWESPLDEGEFDGLHPIGAHIVEVAKRFGELAAPRGDAAQAARAALEAAEMVATPKSRSLARAHSEQTSPVDSGCESSLLMTPVWRCIQRIEELQAAITGAGQQKGAPAPTAARAMRPLLRPHVAAALEPVLLDDAPEWPPARRLRWLSFAVAAMLPEVALGPGRQALLEAASAEERMSLAFEVLSARRESLSALLALQTLQPTDGGEGDDARPEEPADNRADETGVSLREAARLERLAQRSSMSGSMFGGQQPADAGGSQREKRLRQLRWLQGKAIQEAAECQLNADGDDSKCEVEWQRVKDLSDMVKDDDGGDGKRGLP